MAGADKNRGYDAEEYGRLAAFDGEWRDSWWNQDYLELLAARLDLGSVETILDVGAGAGHWGQRLLPLTGADASLVGIDHEEGFMEAARARAAQRLPGRDVRYEVASVEHLPFDDASFDLVTCQTVLMHVPDAEKALAEMVRVTRPGGWVIGSEPNNLANVLIESMTVPETPIEDALTLLRFEAICRQGKIAQGHGDASIGERLPGLFAAAGLGDLRVYKNDKCPALYPPYDTDDQKLDLSQLFAWFEQEVSSFGDRESSRSVYEAGGGDPTEFDAIWPLILERQRAFRADLEAARVHGARGFCHYLVAGRRT